MCGVVSLPRGGDLPLHPSDGDNPLEVSFLALQGSSVGIPIGTLSSTSFPFIKALLS
jgi:hypothetical protein